MKTKDLAPNAVTSTKIAPNSVSSPHVIDSSLTGADVKTESLTGSDLTDGSVTRDDILNGTIQSADVEDSALTGDDIFDDSLTGLDVSPNSLISQDIGQLNPATDFNIAIGTRVEEPKLVDDCSTPPLIFPSSAYVALAWIEEPYDFFGNHVDACPPNGGRITIPATGTYVVGAGVVWSEGGGGGERALGLRKNGEAQLLAEDVAGVSAGGYDTTQTVTTVWRFNSGDYVEAVVKEIGAGAAMSPISLNVSDSNEHRNFFYVQWISA